jgi:hypothetical protein
MKTDMRKRRPPRKKDRTEQLHILVSQEERERWFAAAHAEGQDLSAWIRKLAEAAAS